jgi:hypothetical protein
MHIDCENCGEASPLGALACVNCSEPFNFLHNDDAAWEPNDYSMWLYSQHFQICKKCYDHGIDALSASERLNYLVGYLYYQVLNGGVWQYMANPCGPDAVKLSAALKSIGAHQLAAAIDECLSYFPPGGPPIEEGTRDEFIDNIPEQAADELDEKISNLIGDEDSAEDILVLLRVAIRKIEIAEAGSKHA